MRSAAGQLPSTLPEISDTLEPGQNYATSYLAPGEVFTMTWQGGGGYGDPLTREPDAVAGRRSVEICILAAGNGKRHRACSWSVEGLLMYLPAAAQDLLFTRVQGLTGPGSRIAVEALASNFADPEALTKRREHMDRVQALMAKADPQRQIPRSDELWYFEQREDVGDWLRGHGWQVTVTPSEELMARYGREPAKDLDDVAPWNFFVSAQRTGT